MTKFNGKTLTELEARSATLNKNTTLWDNGELGEAEEHARPMLKTSIRLPEELIASLKSMAGDEGLNYQSYVRRVLTLHVKENVESKLQARKK
jgi:predicted DNA binding CopG/RHH family protein